MAAYDARPAPMLTPDAEPAMTDWSLQQGVRHLNHGSFGAVPLVAQRAQAGFRQVMDENPCAWFTGLPERVAAARSEIAGYLHSDPRLTALVPNASAGVSVVYANIPTSRGMEILVTDHAYGAVAMGAGRLVRRCGGVVRIVRIPFDADADAATELVMSEVTDRTALMVIDQVTSATGREMPAGAISAAGRAMGVPVLVDAAHAPGLFAEPLAGINADFWVGNLHKFACAPRGTAVLVASGPLAQRLNPLMDSWGAPYPFPERARLHTPEDYEDFAERVVPLLVELGRGAQSGERPGCR